MTNTIALSIVPISLVLFWTLSFRRGPTAILWLALSIVFATLCDALAEAMLTHNVPLGNIIAAMGGLLVIPAVCVLVHELCALDDPTGWIGTWRQNNLSNRVSKWRVNHRAEGDQVCVYITNGPQRRVIGWTDPIKDDDAYLDLQISAQCAAATYNDLGVK